MRHGELILYACQKYLELLSCGHKDDIKKISQILGLFEPVISFK
jgi:hypothetical protein